jgi:methylated-DNA-[protein]-cysteine S-methyltransferase
MNELFLDRLVTPIGDAVIVYCDGRLFALEFDDCHERLARLLGRRYGRVQLIERGETGGIIARLAAYFAGELRAIDGIVVETGGTTFQRAVWQALRRIPAGSTMAYGALAAQIGHPAAARAVGAANGSNPVSVVVPCHRLVGANAALVKYGGGLHRKAWLLRHEGAWS